MINSSFNPIIRHEAIVGWNPFAARPQPEPGVAIVLVRKGQPSLTLLSDDPVTRSLVRWNEYQWAFWIDISEQTFTLQCSLPSKEPGLDFQASAYVVYKVNDPVAILRRRITDARAIIEPPLLRLLRRESRQYTLEQCPKAEQMIRKAVKAQLRQGDIALMRCIVTLDVEEEERNHARTLRAADRHYAHSLRHVTYRAHMDELEVPLARKQIEFYREIAKTGDLQILWLYLTANRDDIQTVLSGFNAQRQLDREHWLKVLSELRKDGGIEALHLDHLRTSVLDRLAEIERQSGIPAALASGSASTGTSGATAAGASGGTSTGASGATAAGASGGTAAGASGGTSTGASGATAAGASGGTAAGASGATAAGASGGMAAGASGVGGPSPSGSAPVSSGVAGAPIVTPVASPTSTPIVTPVASPTSTPIVTPVASPTSTPAAPASTAVSAPAQSTGATVQPAQQPPAQQPPPKERAVGDPNNPSSQP